jgi:5-methylcytosine-specific restriction endonuclease McrA
MEQSGHMHIGKANTVSARYYGTRAWRRLAAECLARDPVCVVPGCGRDATVADHIIPRAEGGADTLAQLQGLCARCHSAKRGRKLPQAKGAQVDGTPRDPGHWWQGSRP